MTAPAAANRLRTPSPVWHRRLFPVNHLPMPRVWLQGPKWRRLFDVKNVPIAEIDRLAARYHRPGRKVLTYDFAEDVRELVCEQIRFDVFAEWCDPREILSRAKVQGRRRLSETTKTR